MKFFIASLSALMGVLFCFSTVSAQMPYREAAAGFLAFLKSPKTIAAIDIIEENLLNPDLPPITAGALVRLEGGGYLLISSSLKRTPIKAYSLSRPFDDLPPPVQRYYREVMEASARTARAETGAESRNPLAANENEGRWDFLLNGGRGRHVLDYTPDTWLLKTTWNQGYPFNKFTPQIGGSPTVTGCVNTALAQIMKYYSRPAAGKGVVSYDWQGQTLKAILFKTYNWEDMPDHLDAATPAWQADQVASLMSDVGIVNRTYYGVGGSSVSLDVGAFIENFGYTKDIQSLSNEDIDIFFNALKTQIDAEQPVLLSLPDHMVVADGYASDGAGRRIHLNMGWGGYGDDFYFLDPAENDQIVAGGYPFNINPGNLRLYFPFKPCSGADCRWAVTAGGADVPPVINTIFTDRILKGTSVQEERIYVDARDENGDAVTISAASNNTDAVYALMDGQILILRPAASEGGAAGRVTVIAEGVGHKSEKSFVVLSADESIGYGKAFDMTGQFKDGAAVYRHSAILDGACTIRGDRGYGNQAFYTSILDADDTPVIEATDDFMTGTFAQGRYTITASLRKIISPIEYYQYPYEPGIHERYSLAVTCPGADDDFQTIAEILGIDLSELDLRKGDINKDKFVDLADAIIALQILSRQQTYAMPIAQNADVNRDGRLGAADAIYILQIAAGLRN